MSWSDLFWATVCIVALFLASLLLRVAIRLRMASARCLRCSHRFGRSAAFAALGYYHRLYGPNVYVCERSRKYNGTHVMTCPHCGTESVYGELGGYREPFEGKHFL